MINSMTNTYFNRADKGSGLSIFIRLLTIWKGSLYKLVLVDLIAYLIAFYAINFIYRFALTEDQKKVFVNIIQFSQEVKGRIPFFFLLGFFVTGVIARWIQMYMLIPWLNRYAFVFEGYINGSVAKKSLRIRRTILRYLNLSWILLMRKISDQISLRFSKNSSFNYQNGAGSPRGSSIIGEEANIRDIFINFNRDKKIQQTFGKIITDSEIRAFENIAVTSYKKTKKEYEPEFWIPIQWASRVIQKSFLHGYVSDPRTINKMIEELDNIRLQMQNLEIFCGIMIPLVYTQVVIIAVYSYFLCELFASQLASSDHEKKKYDLDFYVPIFTIFNFLFMMGWLKVAMCVMNPFGDDDEDFPTSDILDDNLDVTFRSVSGEADMFPERLDPPFMEYSCRFEIDPPDNLEQYLDSIDYDLEDYSKDYEQSEVNALVMKKTIWQRVEDRICCKGEQTVRTEDYQMTRKEFHKKKDPKAVVIQPSETIEENLVDLTDKVENNQSNTSDNI